MKKLFCIIMIGLFLVTNVSYSLAVPPDFSGGVNNEYDYEEVVFISGEPVVVTGSGKNVSIKTTSKTDKITTVYKVTLEGVDSNGKPVELSRNITYETALYPHEDKGQTTSQTTVKKFKEQIEVDKNRYKLEDYQFSKSDIIDNRPASDYHAGSFKARKTYSINKDEGKVVIDITGNTIGYHNFWGSTEKQQIEQIIDWSGPNITNNQGVVDISSVDSQTRSLIYTPHTPNLTSFEHAHTRTTNRDMYSEYSYNLPLVSGKALRGNIDLTQEFLPRIERMVVPKFRDIGGHWAEEDIQKLYALDIFEGVPAFFVPDAPMTRIDFIRAVVKGAQIRISEPPKSSRTSRGKNTETAIFRDIPVTHPDYSFVKEGVNRGITSGVSEDLFMPQSPLTRAQAITIVIKALGWETCAPSPGFATPFVDDADIPNWAKDSIYVAWNTGLVSGDASNRINPNQPISRAEASALVIKFLYYLEKELQQDHFISNVL